jgi:hypothetical protein
MRRGPDDLRAELDVKLAKPLNAEPSAFMTWQQDKHTAEDQQAEVSCHWQPSSNVEEMHRQAAEAWSRLTRGQCLADWLAVGASLAADRAEAMREAHSNQPRGPGYSEAFKRLLSRRPFADLEKTTRARLLQVMEHLAEIQEWLGTLTLSQRLKINHPHTIWKAWKKATQVPDPDKPKPPSRMAEIKQINMDLQEENHRLKENGGSLFDPQKDRAHDIAKVLISSMSRRKAKELHRLLGGDAQDRGGGVVSTYDTNRSHDVVPRSMLGRGSPGTNTRVNR